MVEKKNIKKYSKRNNTCSVVILSYNTKNITDRCLQSVEVAKEYCEKKLKNNVETIVVENGSSDGSLEMVRKKYEWVKLIIPGENTGFARGNNLGMKKAQGSYILLLNSDSLINKETIVSAIKYMEDYPSCDVLGCKLTFENGKFQPSAGFLPNLVNIFYWMLGIDKIPLIKDLLGTFHPNNPDFFSKDRSLGWVTGAFILLKKEVFEKTGGFDEKYFMYAEEVEWCKRIKEAAFNICFTPSFEIIHLKQASSQFNIREPLIKEAEGILYYFKKHYPNQLSLIRFGLFLGSFIRMCVFAFLGNKEKTQAYREIAMGKIWRK